MKVSECNVTFNDGRILAPGEYTLIVSEEEDSDIMTPEEELAIKQAWEEYRRGETISHEDLMKELGL